LLYRAHIVTPLGPDSLVTHLDGALLLDGEGRILEVGPFQQVESRHPGSPMLDLRPRWILPGLVDLHTHVPQYEAVAMDGLELLPWLERHIYPAEDRFKDPGVATRAARRFFADQLALGTTTVMAFCTVHQEATDAVFREAERCGIRAALGKVQMDRNVPKGLLEDTQASLHQSEELCQQWHGQRHGRLTYAFAPRFAPACSPELLRGTARLAERHGAYIQTHVSENLGELAWVRDLFPEATGYLDVYRAMGLLGPRTVMAHGIHLAREERALMRETSTSLVHCPRSNAFLQSGTLSLRACLEEGLTVGLGTDVGAGPSLSLWHEMAMACYVSKLRIAELRTAEAPLTPIQAFWLATLGGAKALGLENQIGSLEAGKDGDFIVVEPRATDPAESRDPEPPEQLISRLIYRADPWMVRATFVRGQQCGLGQV